MYERDQQKLLEVGISRSMPGCPDIGQQTHHLIVADNLALLNGEYCANNRLNFLPTLGMSEFIYEKHIASRVAYLIEELVQGATEVILVGHSVAGDLGWLRQHGVYIAQFVDGVCDIGRAYRAMVSPDTYVNMIGMHAMLEHLGITPEGLHNGGNDAYYNLVVLDKMMGVHVEH